MSSFERNGFVQVFFPAKGAIGCVDSPRLKLVFGRDGAIVVGAGTPAFSRCERDASGDGGCQENQSA